MAFNPDAASVGSLMAAALESAGVSIQGEVLEWLRGPGMMLAALVYLRVIVEALIRVAQGENVPWALWLLIGPPIYFFCIGVTNPANNSNWQFAEQRFDDTHVMRALRGVNGNGGTVFNNTVLNNTAPVGRVLSVANSRLAKEDNGSSGADVSLPFHLWNAFSSNVTQELISLLHLTQDESHLNFLTKFQRYMNLWLFPKIPDHNLQRFVRLVMINQCADYYMMQMAVVNPQISQVEKTEYARQLGRRELDGVYELRRDVTRDEDEMAWWLINEAKFQPGMYNCTQIWNEAVRALREVQPEAIEKVLSENLGIGQTEAKTTATWLKKMGIETNNANEQVKINEGNALEALNWVIARALWVELGKTNKYNEYLNREGHSGFFATSMPNGMLPIQNSGTNTGAAIRQVNVTQTYQHKGELVNAALSMPYFQGVGLLLLAASFPFFAMASILPSRMGAILSWAGLWIWLKLWDLGFAVVMMVDNILYTLFPRGPALSAADMGSAGRAFVRLMAADPSYSSRMYYNIIAVCLFAVPIVTGIFVKGAASSVVGLFGDTWRGMATRLGLSSGTFSRSLQGQGFVQQQRSDEATIVGRAFNEALRHPRAQQDMQEFLIASGGTELLNQVLSGKLTGASQGLISTMGLERAQQIAGKFKAGANAANQTQSDYLKDIAIQRKASLGTHAQAFALLKGYNHSSGPNGWWAAESAVRAGYYSHDTARDYPAQQIMNTFFTNMQFNQERLNSNALDATFKSIVNGFAPGKGGASK